MENTVWSHDYLPINPTTVPSRETTRLARDESHAFNASRTSRKLRAEIRDKLPSFSPPVAHVRGARFKRERARGAVPNLIYVNLRSRSGDSTKRAEFGGCVHCTHIGSEWMDERARVGDGESGFIASLLSRECRRTSGENRRKLCH